MSVHISTILDSSPASTRLLRAGEIIFGQGDHAAYIYRIECGQVKLSAEGVGGQVTRVTRAFLFPGDIFGQIPGRRGATAESATDVVLKAWPSDVILGTCGRSPEIVLALASPTNLSLEGLRRASREMLHLPPTDRVIWFLNWFVRRERREATAAASGLPVSRHDIGKFLQLEPMALGSAISTLEALGYLHASSASYNAFRPAVFTGGQAQAERVLSRSGGRKGDASG